MLLLPLVIGLLLALTLQTDAQSFPIPDNWRNPQSNLNRASRLQLVDGLLNTLQGTLNTTTGLFDGLAINQTPILLCGLAIGDRINGSTTNKDVVLRSLNVVFGMAPTIVTLSGSNGDAAIWGLAAMNAYRTYNDQQSLQFARSAWTQLNSSMVTPEDIASGKSPLKERSISKSCHSNSTNAGAVFFFTNNATNTDTNAQTTAGFMALSAHLYELTSEQEFLTAAESSASFVLGPLYDGNIIIDTITLENCAPSTTSLTYNSGHAIDGLAVLGSIDSSYAAAAAQLVSTAIPNPQWTDHNNGIITEGLDPTFNHFTSSVKTIFIRALYEAYTRIPPDSKEATLIRSYIFVQYNSLIDFASIPGTNQYNPIWLGPAPTQLLPWGQMAAIDTLYSAIDLPNNIDNTTTSSNPGAPTTTTVTPQNTGTGSANAASHRVSPAVVGGIVAGVMLLLILVGALVVLRRRRRRPYAEETYSDTATQQTLESGGHLEEVSTDMKHTFRPSSDGDTQGGQAANITSSPAPSGVPPRSSYSAPPEYATAPSDRASDREDPISDLHSDSTSSAGGEQVRVDLASLQGVVQHINRLLVSQQNVRGLPNQPPPIYEE